MSEKEYPDWLIEARKKMWQIRAWLDMNIQEEGVGELSDVQRALSEAEYVALDAAQSIIFQRIKCYCGYIEAARGFIDNGQPCEGEQ